MKTHNDLKGYLGHVKTPDKTSHDSAVGLFTLPNLQSLELELVRLNEAFYGGIVTAAPHSKVFFKFDWIMIMITVPLSQDNIHLAVAIIVYYAYIYATHLFKLFGDITENYKIMYTCNHLA